MMQVAYVACWWLALEVIGLISFPLVSRVCGGLADKGYSISKLVGLVLLTYFTWMLSSLKLMPFGTISILVSFILLAALALFLGRKHLRIANWPRKQIIISESVFALAFLMFLGLRMGKPDIYFSGAADAFFNFAFIESILRADYFPPLDPWFAGESIPYYYGGHLMVAALSQATRVPPAIAFNIAGAMFAALAVCASYGLGYNITKRKLYGFLAAFFVCIVGYTSGFFQLMAYAFGHEFLGLPPQAAPSITEWLLWFSFWDAPWLVQGGLVHYPYFSFLLGDLHSYWMSIPFQLMFIMLIFALYQRGRLGDEISRSDTLLHILILGLCLGFFSILNTWEYPTYMIFTILAFILLRIRPSVKGTLVLPAAIAALSFIAYIPYFTAGGMSGFRGLGLVTARTNLAQFLEYGALFLFASLSLLFVLSKRKILVCALFVPILFSLLFVSSEQQVFICALSLLPVLSVLFILPEKEIFRGVKVIWAALFVLLASILAAVLLDFQLLIIVVPMGLLSLYLIYTSQSKSGKEFILLLLVMSAALAFFCDFLYIDDALDGDWARFNTVLKVYLQLWVFFGVSAACAVFYVLNNLGRKTKVIWVIMLVILVIACLVHPIASTTSLLSGRHTHWGMNQGTLDGMAYVEMVDKGDYDAIQWINEEIAGTPVILEARGNPNLFSSRISAFTGLPTVIGWGTWEVMWRLAHGEVEDRNRDVDMIYNTPDNDTAMELLRKYDVEYIYIGTLERETYESEGLQKFAANLEDYYPVYEHEGVTIFEVRGE